jgi:hypothetical protein
MAPQQQGHSTMRPADTLLILAGQALGLTQRELGEVLNVSRRTIQRCMGGKSRVYPEYCHELARRVHPVDSALAAELARAGQTTLEELRVVPRPSQAAPAASEPALAKPLARHLVADAVVCAAADAAAAPPEGVRALLLAAFARARELGLTLEDVEEALRARAKAGAARPPRR